MMRRLLPLLLAFALGALAAILWPAGAIPPRPPLVPALVPLPLGWGLDAGWACCAAPDLARLHPAWYFDYWPEDRWPSPVKHLMEIDTWVSVEQASLYAARYPGRSWIMANEPDVPGTGNTQPPAVYWAWVQPRVAAIRAADPTARVIMAGLDGHSTAYAAQVLALLGTQAHYFDAWNLHYFTTDPGTYYSAVAAWRAWMDGTILHGVPLIVGEVGVPPAASDGQAAALLAHITPLPPGVRAVAWFHAKGAQWGGPLLTQSGTLTPAGAVFAGLYRPHTARWRHR